MEAERYRRMCRLIDQVCVHGRRKRQQFGDAVIVKVFCFAVLRDRPVSFACVEANWPEDLLERVALSLPSQSTMSRRLRSIGVIQVIERLHHRLAEALGDDLIKTIDSKPLPVGNYSKDHDAKRGRAAGRMARGYKIHAVCSGQATLHWTLLPMNVNDQIGAAMLLPRLSGFGYVVGDNGYDANPVHEIAAAIHHQLVAPPRPSNQHVRDTRRNTPERLRALDLCADPLQHCYREPTFAGLLWARRKQIERNFGNATMDGLHAPPPWIRTPRRVALWAGMKLILRMLRQVQIKGLRA